nr:MAG TPA: hypothetical protein [Bacteriophage sp.]
MIRFFHSLLHPLLYYFLVLYLLPDFTLPYFKSYCPDL